MGVLKAKILKEKYEPKLEIPKGWEIQTKKLSVGGVWIFSGTTHCDDPGDYMETSLMGISENYSQTSFPQIPKRQSSVCINITEVDISEYQFCNKLLS